MAIDLPNTSGGTTNYLRWALAPVSALPYTMHIRCNCDSLADAHDSGSMLGMFNSGDTKNRAHVYAGLSGDGKARAHADGDDGLSCLAASTTVMSAGTWYSIVGQFSEPGSVFNADVWTDNAGTGNSTDASYSAPSGMDRVTCGRWDDSTPGFGFDGKLQDAAIWNEELSSADRAALAAGFSPLVIRPHALVFYSPLYGAGYALDLISGTVATEGGSPATSAHDPTSTNTSRSLVNTGGFSARRLRYIQKFVGDQSGGNHWDEIKASIDKSACERVSDTQFRVHLGAAATAGYDVTTDEVITVTDLDSDMWYPD